MATPLHIDIDLSGARRLLTVGDLHGHLDILLEALERISYDPSQGDRLLLLGDILDRGPDVLRIMDWLTANPDVLRVLGNHDHMLIACFNERWADANANVFNLLRNGGDWLLDYAPAYDPEEDRGQFIADMISSDDPASLVDPRIVAFARLLAKAPPAIRAKTPGGRTVGFVHGDPLFPTWEQLRAGLHDDDADIRRNVTFKCMWERTAFDRAKRASQWGTPDPADFTIPDIDHIFLGHSITKEPMIVGNCSWIDTGVYKHNVITVVDVDDWISNLA